MFATLAASVEDLRTAADREARAKEVTVAVVGLEKLVLDLENGVTRLRSEPEALRRPLRARVLPLAVVRRHHC